MITGLMSAIVEAIIGVVRTKMTTETAKRIEYAMPAINANIEEVEVCHACLPNKVCLHRNDDMKYEDM